MRRAEEADARAIAEVHVRAWVAAYRGLIPDEELDRISVDQREARWRETLATAADRGWLTLVATGDRRRGLEGFCTIAMPSRDADADERTAEVVATYVDPARWRSGVGTRLLADALAEARAAEHERATLWVIAANAGARGFYRLHGFEPDGASREWKDAAIVRLRAMLTGIALRPLDPADAAELRRIHATTEVRRWWGRPAEGFPFSDERDVRRLTIEYEGAVAGMIQFGEEPEPRYRHASVDLFLDPGLHGRGLGTEAVRRIARHLIADRGHHRVTIDPAASNLAAIRAYEKVGFRPVGVMRRYERDADGDDWHDGLLMDLLAGEERPPEGIGD